MYQTYKDILPHGDLKLHLKLYPEFTEQETKHAELCEQSTNSGTGH